MTGTMTSRPWVGRRSSSSSSASACTPAISSPWMPACTSAVGPGSGASKTWSGSVGENQWTPAGSGMPQPVYRTTHTASPSEPAATTPPSEAIATALRPAAC